MITILDIEAHDIRFPTSEHNDGSDTMNFGAQNAPDYSSAVAVIKTSVPDLEGHGLTFTIGRGNDLCCQAITAMKHLIIGKNLSDLTQDMGAFWKLMNQSDTQLRWVSSDSGVVHLATAAIVNAVWDLYAKVEKKPLWQLLVDMSAEELVRCVDFRYITDALTPQEAIAMLKEKEATKQQRIEDVKKNGVPSYLTSAGWLGYPTEKIRAKCKEAIQQGYDHLKIKVGRDLEDDKRRVKIVREEIGPDRHLMVDANQVWDVEQAITWVKELAQVTPLFWIEEPTSPIDVLGHARIAKECGVPVATGEHCPNRIIFKQLMQANAISYCQIDTCRLAGVNEVLASFLLAAKFKIPVCQHAGGTLCELVSHMAIWDFVSVCGTREDRLTEYVDHLHEHFEEPSVVNEKACYMCPQKPGYLVGLKKESMIKYRYPDGPVWKEKLSNVVKK